MMRNGREVMRREARVWIAVALILLMQWLVR